MRIAPWVTVFSAAAIAAIVACENARTTTPGGGDRGGGRVDTGVLADGGGTEADASPSDGPPAPRPDASDAGAGADVGPAPDAEPGADGGGGRDATPGDARFCLSAEECSDGDPCNGAEVCDMNTLFCRPAVSFPQDGTECDRDMDPSTRDLCLGRRCARSTCGDGFADLGATPPEQCDDGNRIGGDGCEGDCTTRPTTVGFRFNPFEVLEPHLFANLGTCSDVTGLVNARIDQAVSSYQSNTMIIFRPLDQTAGMSPAQVIIGAMCTASTSIVCEPAMTSGVHSSTVTNTRTGAACFTPDAAVVNPAYTPAPMAVSPPCFASSPQTLMVNFFGLNLTLYEARLSAVYTGVPATALVNGLLVGFVKEEDARNAIFPANLPPLSGTPLYLYLSAGGASGSGCNGVADDRDTTNLPGLGPTRGFWFHFGFNAERVSWLGP